MPDSLARLDDRPIPKGAGEIRTFMVVRNETLRIASTLDHYRKLGVDRFFVIDNGSEDGTREFLGSQPDVHSFSTTVSYAASKFGIAWLNALCGEYGEGHWTLVSDADELFVYPHFERVDLKRFCRFLDAEGAEAVFVLMLDMYSDRPIRETRHQPGTPLLATCPYFDPPPSYRYIVESPFPHLQFYGGPRERVFSKGGIAGPLLSKLPLVKWRAGMTWMDSAHSLAPAVKVSKVLGVLLHFKFLHDFHERARIEVARGEHYDNASEYRAYLDALERDPSLTLRVAGSLHYRNSAQLEALSLMHSSPEFERFVAELAR